MSNFGLDLLLESQKANIKSKNDIVVIILHWMLCKNDLRNVGIGDSKFYNENDRPSELLPEGWNQDSSAYSLRYMLDKNIYLLYANSTSDSLVVNLIDAKTLQSSSLAFDVNAIVKSTTGRTIDDFVSSSEDLIKRIGDEIVKPIFKKDEKKAKTSEESTSNPLLVRPPQRPPMIPSFYDSRRDPLNPFIDPLRDIGRGDLDPLGRGGGMLFQSNPSRYHPGRLGGLPPDPGVLGIPPGARYDPPNPLGRLNPDNDHLPPPGYDDMFM
ncbi:CLUMA_CG012803, isoform A [Clunio marinus]|uniref:Proteasome inhibitor PI31 subunit n=1 Tax=Clunio marinus TaxID=568069 RepID=A0A1J1IIW7_9DIPT|nr:CLUMA_CG012803, isoform A [Clunio marinus]